MEYPNYLTCDIECSGATNDTYGNPFTDGNKLCVVGYGNSDWTEVANIVDQTIPIGPALAPFRKELGDSQRLYVGFNCKFDLHWLRRYGIVLLPNQNVWDCQLAHFIIHDQQHPLPSLEECATYYNLENKFLAIETEFWDKGIDTDKIPRGVVEERVKSDVRLTSRLAEIQWDLLRRESGKKRLIWVSCQDQKVLEEMEWNGLKYNIDLSIAEGNKIRSRQKEIERQLSDVTGIEDINWNSKDHLSCVLYGGTIKFDKRETYTFTYKDGSTKQKERLGVKLTVCSRRVEPLHGTEYAKGGIFSTDESNLSKLKVTDRVAKKVIELIQEYRKLDKRVGTYYHGIPRLYKEMGWTGNLIHGQLNSSVAVTGRLASSKPNQQNMDTEIRKCLVSRYTNE